MSLGYIEPDARRVFCLIDDEEFFKLLNEGAAAVGRDAT